MATAMAAGTRQRIDRLLVERGLCDSRTRAQALILAGKVIVNDHAIDKAGTLVALDAAIRVKGLDHPFVSRGGVKLRGALDAFSQVEVAGKVALDIGASTGGFTDCLLQAGAAKVFAVDVGYGQLAWKLAEDPRVVVIDRQNIRDLAPETLGEKVQLAVADCSFISLSKVLPAVTVHLAPNADMVALVKPQFEVGRGNVGKGGIVRDDEARNRALQDVAQTAIDLGFVELGRCDSPITGQDGNHEFFLWLRYAGKTAIGDTSGRDNSGEN